MREILFRGKRKDNNEWIEGYYAHPTYYLDDRDFHIIFPLNFVAYPRCEFSDYEEVIPETVGRYTGLNEKNENGKKIFEGDIIMSERMEKYNYVAIVNLVEDYNKKDYGFALYDSEWEKSYDGCYVLVNPQNKIALGVIKEVKTIEEYGKNVTKEVIGVCDISCYNDRVEARQRELERQKKEAQLRKELDERISKLKDMEYYNRMAKELADKDPEIANLVSELGTVVE